MTAAAAMLLAHARWLGTAIGQVVDHLRTLLVCVCLLFCCLSKHRKDVLFWSALIVVEGFLAVSAMRVYGFSQSCGWGLVGAVCVCGGFCAAKLIQSRALGSFISGLSVLSVWLRCSGTTVLKRWIWSSGWISRCWRCRLYAVVFHRVHAVVLGSESSAAPALWRLGSH